MSVPDVPPPSYDEVVSSFNTKVGPNASPTELLAAASSLSEAEKSVLIDAAKNPATLTDEEKKKFAVGAAMSFSQPETVAALQESAALATQAVRAIDDMFVSLTQELTTLDQKYTSPVDGPFAPRLTVFATKYRETVRKSREVAVEIAVHAESFDKVLKQVVQSPNVTLDQKIGYTDGYIQQAEEIKGKSEAMEKGFHDLKDGFAVFTGSFQNWAADKKAQDEERLKNVMNEINRLNDKIRDITISLYTFGAIAAFSLPVTGVIAAMSGPAAPFVILGGCIVAGISVAIVVGLAAGLTAAKNEKGDREKEAANLRKDIEMIASTQANLKTLAENDLKIFSDNISVLVKTWTHCTADAVEVRKLLVDAKQTGLPLNLKTSLVWEIHTTSAVNVYNGMAKYLRAYAQDVISVNDIV
ncbi:hypothetical protein BCR34DRAFT_615842 [Clohesyomyces aquaticus]|uniref:Uncharacterized protein n=1 Tax=Clohesyomyces aquaticus TaxID=1231657 RepID=A0A1Y1ZH86_9PLEO|nr:hypothetical protein BCR34DRAFT_615842 [Clohesyomyces aquaticus]